MNLLRRFKMRPSQSGSAGAGMNLNGAMVGVESARVELKPGAAKTYFFISGHPRSGTNWLSNLCNLHPDICCHGEFHFEVMYDALEKFTAKRWYVASEAHVKSVAEHAIEQLVHRTLDAMAENRKPGARIIGDHTPKPFQVLVSDGAYIVAMRDGRDVIVSWTFHLLRTGMAEIVHEQTRQTFLRELSAGMDDSARLKVAAQNLLRDQEWVTRLASGWALEVQNDLPRVQALKSEGGKARVLVVRYEDLLQDVEGGRARIYEFLGAAPDKAEPLSAESKTTPGFGREDPKSFYRKGEAGDWKNYLDDRGAGWFKACAAKELIDAGYETGDSW